jgi:ATP synthase protein I
LRLTLYFAASEKAPFLPLSRLKHPLPPGADRNFAAGALREGVRRVILIQGLLSLFVAAGFGYVHGGFSFLSALYGGAITLLLTVWLGRGVWRARGLGALYAFTITRYAAAMLFLGFGMGVLKLAPLPLIVAFAVAQLGFLARVHRP